MTQPIVFYDLNRVVEDPKDLYWNPNTWKTRYALIDAWDATPLMLNGLFGSAPMIPWEWQTDVCVSRAQ